MTAAQSLVIVNYLTAGRLVWVANLFAAGPHVFVTVSSLNFVSLSLFYLAFVRRS